MVSLMASDLRSVTDPLRSQGCTAKAIIHRVAKFREAASKLDLQDGTAVPATPPTVKKRARKTKADEDQDGDGASATPTKKARTPKTKKAATTGKDDVEEEKTFKVEAADEEETMAAA